MPTQGIFRANDLKIIESKLYKPKDFELRWSELFDVVNQNPIGSTYGYQVLKRKGGARITGHRPLSQDFQFNDFEMDEVTYKACHLNTGFGYSDEELDENSYVNSLNSGQAGIRPQINIEFEKAEASRRFLNEEKNRLVFKGQASLSITGLFTNPLVVPVAVSEGAVAGTPTFKKKFKNKTGIEIQNDFIQAIKVASADGRYTPDTLVISFETSMTLQKRYNDFDSRTVFEVIKQYFKNIYIAQEFTPRYNQIDPAYDSAIGTDIFMVYEKSPENLFVPVMVDLEITQERIELSKENKFVLYSKMGGLAIRRPQSVYIGRDI